MKATIDSLLKLINDSDGKLKLFEHNGETIAEYPTSTGWNLVPFPMEKGEPFNADNLATTARAPFLNDLDFQAARIEGERRWEGAGKKRDISWRLDIMLWAISHALRSWDGKSIFVECGTGKGYMASAISTYFKWDSNKPKFYLIDSFSPFVPDAEGVQVEGNNTSFVYSTGDEEVRNYFSQFPNIEVLAGFIPDILSRLPDKKICFLHVDLNSAVAESAALDGLKAKLNPGAIVLFDDYGGFGGEGQAEVHEKFIREMGARILSLPTGQAMYFHV